MTLEGAALADGRKRITGHQGGRPLEVEVEEILVAAGRIPNVEDLGLEAAGVRFSAAGIETDATLLTSASTIWAAGDCVAGAPRFTSLADHQARVAAHNALGGAPVREAAQQSFPPRSLPIPSWVGSGSRKRRRGPPATMVRAETVPDARPSPGGDHRRDVRRSRIVADATSGRLLGGSVLAAGGGELLGEIALAVRLGLTGRAIADTLHAYPDLLGRRLLDRLGAGQARTLDTRPRVVSRPHAVTWTRWTTRWRAVEGDNVMNEQDAGGEDTCAYNYAEFVGDDDFLAFRTALPVGSSAPDVSVTVAASGEPARLSDYWRDTDLVIEFGSLT